MTSNSNIAAVETIEEAIAVPENDIQKWLGNFAPGYKSLSIEERNAIMNFSLLWSLFEATALGAWASPDVISKRVQDWSDSKLLIANPFDEGIGYFRNRYYSNKEQKFTHHFDHLHLRDNDKPALVKEVLSYTSEDLVKKTTVTLIIVYRYRNNLFHGTKWAYEIKDQLDNFNTANAVLIEALKIEKKLAN